MCAEGVEVQLWEGCAEGIQRDVQGKSGGGCVQRRIVVQRCLGGIMVSEVWGEVQ